MPLSAGEKLGPYEILELIGAGGMGEVYRARDTRLNRDVAIKVSAERFNDRFSREAQAVAALNHPNICSLFDVGPNFLVMELVEGETLKGPLPVETAMNYARQIAAALEEAHEKGIVHRDLKPANIKIKPDGAVKVLDFGLAKVTGSAPAQSENSPTLSMAATQAGVILGTAAYMSPEQAKGKQVDKRADIWAFGVVFHEMLTGERLFQGDDLTETLAAVVMKQPDVEQVPPTLRRLLKKCLEKDPKKRLRDIGDVWELLEEAAPVPSVAAPTAPVKGGKLPWLAAAVAILAAAGLGYVAYRHAREETRVLRLFVPPPDKGTYNGVNVPAVSPDGRRIVFAADVDGRRALWVRDLDSLVPRLLAGTDDGRFPFWSPDSRTIGFFAGGKLKKIDVAGGPALAVTDAVNGRGGTWSQNDVIVFAPNNAGPLFRVTAAGGTATPLTELDRSASEAGHRFPWFLPDGRHFLYTARSGDQAKTVVYAGELDSKARHKVVAANSNAVYVSSGHLLFMRDRTLMAQPFDAGKALTTGDAFPIAENVDYVSGNSQGQFSASQTGVLAYTSGGADGGYRQLTWFDRSGAGVGTVSKPGIFQWPAISPDGKTVAVDRVDFQTGLLDIWLYDPARGGDSRFTFGPATNEWPVWSPDGMRIAFNSLRNPRADVYQRATNGTAQDELLDKSPDSRVRVDDWSRDGRYIVEERPDDPKTKSDIWILPTFGDKKPFNYLHSEFNEQYAKLSPNGQWLAYQSDESKRTEIYVVTFPMLGGKWQISTGGGTRPVWSRDGKELYFIGTDQKMMTVEIRAGAKFDFGVPKALFEVRMEPAAWFDVSKDGKFLIPTQVEAAASVPMTVVVNWHAALKR
ncbi:MAG TPA: protein kinase [Bryobacteraceae bacterium]|nr:protein kinase [Bryobacteraceae bacterium]